ncbi:hypothetical protein ACE6H2_025432 [Prunus campanulata]
MIISSDHPCTSTIVCVRVNHDLKKSFLNANLLISGLHRVFEELILLDGLVSLGKHWL